MIGFGCPDPCEEVTSWTSPSQYQVCKGSNRDSRFPRTIFLPHPPTEPGSSRGRCTTPTLRLKDILSCPWLENIRSVSIMEATEAPAGLFPTPITWPTDQTTF